jgi:mono/diheme cytochrome c family protein
MKKRALSLGTLLTAVLLAVALGWHAYAAGSTPRQQKGGAGTGLNPAALYSKSCASCHGKDGRGKTFKGRLTHARDLTNAAWQADVTDERLFNSINNGKGKMLAFGKKYSESDINALVAYVRHLEKK